MKQEPKRRRRRGVILTAKGAKKLQQARTDLEYDKNHGDRYTLEELSQLTGLAVDTLMKVFACDLGVDKQTLKTCFQAFNLTLESSDYYLPDPSGANEGKTKSPEPELPEGQVPLNSVFYVERSPIESECYKAIVQPGALIRIKAPRRMGKTSLMTRILHQATNKGYHTVSLSLQLADKNLLQNLDKFLQWFCANVTLGLELPNKLEQYWDDIFGNKISCKIYFEEYLLTQTNQPIVLGLDDVDRLFQYEDLADDFFGLIRAWHEEAKNKDIWKKFRLIVAHSTEVYIPLKIHQSPFNVGLPMELPVFNLAQVLDLAQRHKLDFLPEQAEKLLSMVGGNPYLIRLAMYHILRQHITIEELFKMSPLDDNNIYKDHLKTQVRNLNQNDSKLIEAFYKVIISPDPIELDLREAFQLQSLGLVRFIGNAVTPSCDLYTQYFKAYLNQAV